MFAESLGHLLGRPQFELAVEFLPAFGRCEHLARLRAGVGDTDLGAQTHERTAACGERATVHGDVAVLGPGAAADERHGARGSRRDGGGRGQGAGPHDRCPRRTTSRQAATRAGVNVEALATHASWAPSMRVTEASGMASNMRI